MHVFLPASFSNRQTGEAVAQLTQTDGYGTGQATYDLRRLCLRGLIERLPKSHRYRVTERGGGHRVALAYNCRIHRRSRRRWQRPSMTECRPSSGARSAASTSGSAGSGPRGVKSPQVKTWLKWSGFAFPGAVPLTLESGTRVPSHRGLRTGPVRDRPHRDSRTRQCRPLFPSDGRGVRGRHVWRK